MSRTITDVENEVARLRGLDPVALRARFRALTGKAAPNRVSPALLLRVLAYRIQADAFGDLRPESARLLDRMAGGRAAPALVPKHRAGTVLVREWRNVRHHVMVVPGGFAWNGGSYASLSEVAFAITGTKWSGPRFFGLRVKPGSQDHGKTP